MTASFVNKGHNAALIATVNMLVVMRLVCLLLSAVPGWLEYIHNDSLAHDIRSIIHYKCKKLKQFKTRCKDDMVNSDN